MRPLAVFRIGLDFVACVRASTCTSTRRSLPSLARTLVEGGSQAYTRTPCTRRGRCPTAAVTFFLFMSQCSLVIPQHNALSERSTEEERRFLMGISPLSGRGSRAVSQSVAQAAQSRVGGEQRGRSRTGCSARKPAGRPFDWLPRARQLPARGSAARSGSQRLDEHPAVPLVLNLPLRTVSCVCALPLTCE